MTQPSKRRPYTDRVFGALRAVAARIFPFGRSNVTVLMLSTFFSTFYIYIPIGTLYLQSKGLSYVEINSLWGIIVATKFAAEVPAGVIGDRVGKKLSVNLALAFQLVGEVVYIFARGYPGFVLAAVMGGLGFAFSSGSIEALVYDSLQADRRAGEMTRAMGAIGSAQRLANLLAFAVGGLLVANLTQARFVLAIIVTACAVAIGLLISLTLKEPSRDAESAEPLGSAALVADGLALARENRVFRRLALLSLATTPFIDYLLNLYPPAFVAAGVPGIWLGIAPALASGLAMLASRYAHVLEARVGPRRGLLLAAALPGAFYLLFAAVSRPAPMVVIFCLLYGSMSLKAPILSGQINRHIASRNRATILSLISMASGLYVALAGLLVGRVGDAWLPGAFTLMGAIVLLGTIAFGTERGSERTSDA